MSSIDTSLIIRDVSESLKTTIQQNIDELKAEDAITFQAPGQFDPGVRTCLSLYLYQIEYNAYLRNAPPEVVRNDDGSFMEVRAPVTVDLRYLMAPYSASAETELVIIDQLAQLFYDEATVAATGSLQTSDNNNILITPDLQNLREIRDLWTSFPGQPYKLALYYLMSPVRIPSTVRHSIGRVFQARDSSTLSQIKTH